MASEAGPLFIRTEQVSEILGMPVCTLREQRLRNAFPVGIVAKVGKRFLWNRARLMEWLENGGNLDRPPVGGVDPDAPAPRRRGRPRKVQATG